MNDYQQLNKQSFFIKKRFMSNKNAQFIIV